jgi:hypothetical protein
MLTMKSDQSVPAGAHKAGGVPRPEDKNVTSDDTAMEMRSIGVLHWIKHAVAHGGQAVRHELQHVGARTACSGHDDGEVVDVVIAARTLSG